MATALPMTAGLSPLDSTLGAFDAKTHFSKILEWVARGKEFVVTKHGKAVARISPIDAATLGPSEELIAKRRAVIERMQASRIKLAPGQTIEGLIAEGRRW